MKRYIDIITGGGRKCALSALASLLFAFTAQADWTLNSGIVGDTTMTDGTATLKMTVLDAEARTLRLGQKAADAGFAKTTGDAMGGSKSWLIDLSKPITLSGSDETWTIVEVGAMAFWNSSGWSHPSAGLDLTSVTNIGTAAFQYSKGALKKVLLSSKLQRVGDCAFNQTAQLASYDPQLPPSIKTIGAGAFGQHTQWDGATTHPLSGDIELLGVETICGGAFHFLPGITNIVIGSKLSSITTGGTISGTYAADTTQVGFSPFKGLYNLQTITFLGDAPASVPAKLFSHKYWLNNGEKTPSSYTSPVCYFYEDYTNNWVTVLAASGGTIADYADPDNEKVFAKWADGNDGRTVYLALLDGHPASETEPQFDLAPMLAKSGSSLVFTGYFSEGTAALSAVFTATDGTEYAFPLTSGNEVTGDANETAYTLAFDLTSGATGLPQNQTYSFAIRGTNSQNEIATKYGSGTFFFGEVDVSVSAASVSENGGSLTYAVSRTGTGGSLTVPLVFSGTAAEFTNYREVPHSVTISDGDSSASITVTGVIDLDTAGTTLTVAADTTALLFAGDTATATIADWDEPLLADFSSSMDFTAAGCSLAQSAALANFPVLVRIPADQVSQIGSSAGLAFYQDGTLLPHEVDTWDASSGGLVWVGMDSLYKDAVVTLAYGNANYTAPNLAYDLWNTAGYIAVWHLGETADGAITVANSTVQGSVLDGAANSVTAAKADGMVGAGRTISTGTSSKGWIDMPCPDGYLTSPSSFTVSFFANHDVTGAERSEYFAGSYLLASVATGGWLLRMDPSVSGTDNFYSKALNSGTAEVKPTFSGNTYGKWTLLSASFNGGSYRMSRNGETYDNNDHQYSSLGSAYTFGNIAGHNENGLTGAMDEIRLRNVMSSADWLAAEYATVSDAKFLVSGDDVALSADADKVTVTVGSVATLPLQVQLLGASASAAGSITVDWGDGSTTVTNLDITAAGLAVPLTHAYAAVGNYAVSATATVMASERSDAVSARVGVLPAELSLGSDDSFTRYALLHTKGYAGSTALANFPVLVRISEAAIDGFDYDDCATGGADISFSLPDGTVLPHEIESWNPDGESLVWVKLPTLDGIATAFYLRWNDADPPANDPGAVWSSYVAVIHGGDAITNVVSGGVAAAAGSASVAASATSGYVGGGVNKSVNKAIGLNLANPHASLTAGNQYSVSAWFKRDGNGGKDNNGTHILGGSISSWGASDGFLLIQEKGQYVSVATKSGHNWSSGTALANQVWGHVGFTYDGVAGALVAYFNGVEFQRKAGPGSMVNANAAYWTFGSYMNTATDDSFKGDMDEIRVFDGAATADWAKAEYDSMADAAFLGYGAAEEVSFASDKVVATFAVDSETLATDAATITGTLTTASTNGLDVADLYLAYGPSSETLPALVCYTNGWEQGDSIAIPLSNLATGTTYAVSLVVSNANDATAHYSLSFTTKFGPPDLRISEVGSAVTDPWGNTSSFVEIFNKGGAAVDLEGYVLRRTQKGKNKDIVLPSFTLAAGGYAVIWGSDDNPYENPAVVIDEVIRQGIIKFKASNTPLITLFDADSNVLDTFQVLAGLADGQSMGPSADFDGVNLYYFEDTTPGVANDYTTATELGASFVSTTHSADEVALDADLTVTSTWAPLDGSTISGVKMFYRLAFSNEVEVAMTDSGDGLAWTATIPASVYASAAPGSLIRWRFVATDSRNRTTKEPAFGSADGSPEYYGTITAPGFTSDLPVFHLFVAAPNVGTDLADDPTDDPRNLAAMDIDSDALATASSGAYADMTIGARCSIYYNGHLYDNVTIDLRGNTSANFQKKSHGLKFNKSDKLAYVNPYTGEAGTVRKTSFTTEFMDPSFLRQNVAFQFMNAVGVPAPFHYPVRLQRNGEFYQLGFHSIRFTDEIVDYYGWDDDCELVKNAGSLRKTSSTAGFETKIPEQENESQATANFQTLVSNLKSSDKSVLAWDILNVPMWINYMAATRITQEMDDVWGNLCVYLHNETGTWWPGAYDMNLSFGQYYVEGGWTKGIVASDDQQKSHPLYGGSQVRMYQKGKTDLFTGGGGADANYNGAFDAIYGDPLLRGMHLRRLRTLMDAYLKAPGTAPADTPLWQFFATQTNAMHATALLDRAKWTGMNTGSKIDNWTSAEWTAFRAEPTKGVDEIWNNYIVPRREHLYVTHSAANETFIDTNTVFTAVVDGAFVSYNAGIPDAQSAGLKVRVSRRIVDADGTNTYVKVDNPNAIFLDVSGWTVSDGTTTVTLEPGTVIPPAGALYLVADRKAFTAAHPRAQVLLQGNIKAALVSSDATITVTDTASFVAATYAKAAVAPGEEAISEAADPFADPTQPVIGSRTGSDELIGLSIEPGENEGDPSVLVIPFAAEAGFTYTLKTSQSLLVPVAQWTAASGVDTITVDTDKDVAFRVPMTGTAAFYVISVE